MANKYQEALDIIADQNGTETYKSAVEDIRKLIEDFVDCRNELCIKCGIYKQDKCKGCKWEH